MQKGYEWLWKEPGPLMLTEALKLWGVREVAGPKNNPSIVKWGNETRTTYPGDGVAWCGLFLAITAKRAGWDFSPNGNPLWARNWADWGHKAKTAMLGDVLVFPRGKGGHCAIYVGEDPTHYHILGGNQSDGVNIVRRAKKPIIAIRRAPWRLTQPKNIRVVKLKAGGAPISTNEA